MNLDLSSVRCGDIPVVLAQAAGSQASGLGSRHAASLDGGTSDHNCCIIDLFYVRGLGLTLTQRSVTSSVPRGQGAAILQELVLYNL